MGILKRTLFALLLVSIFLPVSKVFAEPTVGIIFTRNVYSFERIHDAFMARLNAKGNDAGKIKFIIQRPYPDSIAWSNASRKLIAAGVDVIVTYGAPATVSALKEGSGIPVLYAGVYEPVAASLKSDKATGVCSKMQISSLVRYLRESRSLENLGVVYSSLEEDSVKQLAELKDLSKKYGFKMKELNLKRQGDIAGMLADIDVNALFLTSSSMVGGVLPTIFRIAESKKIPTASLLQQEEPGSMITLSSDAQEEGRMAADMLLKLIQGRSVSSVPPVCSKNVELVFNMRQARSLGVRVSMDLVVEATKIIY